jgi:hypothetical protein
MDYGPLSLTKRELPRMTAFAPQILSKQIMAETIGLRGQTPFRMFGAGKVHKFASIFFLIHLAPAIESIETLFTA